MDAISEQRLLLVHPDLRDKVHLAMEALAAQGVYIRVAQGLRTYADQDGLYALGRTVLVKADGTPQHIVTNARGGFSNHNFAQAVDCYPFVEGASGLVDVSDATTPHFRAMVTEMKAQGLAWGGDWPHFPDEPHFQLAHVPVTPCDADRACFAEGGLEAVWQQYASPDLP